MPACRKNEKGMIFDKKKTLLVPLMLEK